ncbi:hypothetical protein K7711_29680 [Nocardia sp. CA2R105]|uniref:hypothetical protein n=1 Tax=Nocardia coffeae TaxID=2873381 RepID=UPI001CA5F66B|nr:hypothetical protein [Nocardia coffeae]MBY8860676.1 hypothetical protein [Nocardia coffeae]
MGVDGQHRGGDGVDVGEVAGASGELFGRPVLEQLRHLVPETDIAAGTLAAPAGRSRTAPAHIDDLAEAAARVLVSDRHRGRCYTLTAADSIDWDDLAKLASTIAAEPVGYQPIEDEQFLNALAGQEIPGEFTEVLLGVYRAFRGGWTGTPTGDLAEILGRAPRPALGAVSAVVSG